MNDIVFIVSICMIVYGLYCKITYTIKVDAICVDRTNSRELFASYTDYEYQLLESDGILKTMIGRGYALGYPKVGKQYKVFVHKKKHEKCISSSVQNTFLWPGVFFLIISSVGLYDNYYTMYIEHTSMLKGIWTILLYSESISMSLF